MSEVAGALAGAGGEGGVVDAVGGTGAEGAAGAVGGAGAAGGAAAGAADRWQDKFLPEDLRADPLLGRYDDIPALAKAHREVNTWAAGRVPIPKAGDDAAFAEFAGKMRPAEAKDYDLPVPEGQAGEVAEAFRPIFHEVGLLPQQATKLATAWNQFQADTASRLTQDGKNELTAIELELGPTAYNQRLDAVNNMFASMGIDGIDVATAMQAIGGGAGKAMRGLFTMAERSGELAKVDGASVAIRMGAMTAEQAQARIDEMSKNPDPAFQASLRDENSENAKLRKQLNRVAAGAPAA